MSQKWNLQDIRPTKPQKHPTPTQPLEKRSRPAEATRENADETMSIAVGDGRKRKNKTLIYALVVFVVIIAGGAIASILMGGAELTVFPRYREPNVHATFEARLMPRSDELSYEIMSLEAEGERQVTATGQEEVSTQAEGTIFIYNTFTNEPMRLVTNTRFESPEGLIFKIKDPAVVPGYTLDDSGAKVPGVTTAEVFAEQSGEDYNIGPSRFTVPGFAGEPEFDGVYAESVESFSGGFEGMRFIIDEDEKLTAQQALQLELRNSLLERVPQEKPSGFYAFDGAVTFTYESLPAVEYGENLATIKQRVVLRIPLFDEKEFASFIAQAAIPGYENEQVRIDDVSKLTFEYTHPTTSVSDISAQTGLTFDLSGRPLIIWEYDEGKLKTDLLGANKTALTTILAGYPAIERAEAVIRPFWKTSFPTDMDDITVVETIE